MKNYSEELYNLEDLGAVYLLLGPACNMSCRHCSQTPVKNCFNMSPNGGELSQDVKDFVVKWSNLPWKYAKNNSRRLYFWGGEPLLYWQTIKKLVLEFEKLGAKGISYRIFSNGLLLNDEIVEFCNEHGIWFIMSYDAPNPTAVRNAIPNNDKCKLFIKINKRTVNTVYNAINNNMVAALHILERKFPGTEISCGFINVLSDIPKDIYAFKKGEVYREVAELGILAMKGNENAMRWFRSKLWRINRWDVAEFEEYPYPPCHPGVVSLSVDFKGNVYRCHNDSCKVGRITDNFNSLQEKHLNEWRKLLPYKCKTCEHLDICRCICPIAVQQDGELCYCDYLREFWQAVKDMGAIFKMIKPSKTYRMEFINGRASLREVE